MKSNLIYLLSVVLIVTYSCNDQKKETTDATTAEFIGDNSMTSLDWEGTYEGILPCADCEGIKTVVTINKDNTYVAKETYVGRSETVYESKGSFSWDENGQKIILDNNRNPYFVGENILTHLDKNGNMIKGNLAASYILQRINDHLVGKKWHLVSFKGEEIQLKEAKAERPSINFNEDMSVNGFTGCNNFQGTYDLVEAQQIKFSQLVSTKKFCTEMETENEFLKTLSNAMYYVFQDHALVIHDSEHQLLAQFKVANED